jgi:aspartate/methionine/tyrosine aminotransferase
MRMDEADRLNAILRRDAPAVARLLSPLGLRAAFPRGIPFQSDEARHARLNATIGQLTDGRGAPMPLPELSDGIVGLDPTMTWLYAPVDGPVSLKTAWLDRQRQHAGNPSAAASLPFVTHGLTHSISLVASLISSSDLTLVVPRPAWENYDLLFGLHASPRLEGWRFFRDDGRLDTASFAQTLDRLTGRLAIILNFPGNPSGYTPTTAEATEIVDAILAYRGGPVAVVVDDAYQGWVYQEDRHPRSLFWDLAERADPERVAAFKIDGATKELLFFSSRVGFLTHSATHGDAEEALRSKLKFVVRGTVGGPSGPAMALVMRGLATSTLEGTFQQRRAVLARRWSRLRECLEASGLPFYPFNSAFFALLPLPPDRSADELRQRLLHEHSVGVISFPEENMIRLAYCSLHEDDIPELVTRLARVLG